MYTDYSPKRWQSKCFRTSIEARREIVFPYYSTTSTASATCVYHTVFAPIFFKSFNVLCVDLLIRFDFKGIDFINNSFSCLFFYWFFLNSFNSFFYERKIWHVWHIRYYTFNSFHLGLHLLHVVVHLTHHFSF